MRGQYACGSKLLRKKFEGAAPVNDKTPRLFTKDASRPELETRNATIVLVWWHHCNMHRMMISSDDKQPRESHRHREDTELLRRSDDFCQLCTSQAGSMYGRTSKIRPSSTTGRSVCLLRYVSKFYVRGVDLLLISVELSDSRRAARVEEPAYRSCSRPTESSFGGSMSVVVC